MIEFSPFLMGGFFLVFILLLIFLNFVFFQPMLKHLEDRKLHLANDQGSAEKDIEEVAKLKAEAAEIIASAKQEAYKLKEQIQKEAKKEAEERVALEQTKIAAEIAEHENAVAVQEEALKNALLGEAPLFKERLRIKFIAA
ncbi:MAG: hypothetical protein LBN32_04735 [Helicobacteraceae bacterium]|jgi:F0F1-type ATP synthase membrane subunit b/b'|nr:hypothetical protein [Helicobacteraceae bacterium]